MIFSKKSDSASPKRLDRRESLAGVPVLNDNVDVQTRDDGRITLVITKKRSAGFWGRFQPREMSRTVKLDELGTFVFKQINGRRNARQIVDMFARRFKLNRREAEFSVVEFIRQLVRRNAISIAMKQVP